MPGWLSVGIVELLWQGLLLTVALTIVTSLSSLIMGVLVGMMRLSGRRSWRWLAQWYVEIFRNVPALVQIIFWAFALPNLFPASVRQTIFFNNGLIDWVAQWMGLALPYYLLAAMLGLVLNTSAYLAELFRAGVGTLPQSRLDAARTLGATPGAVFRRIVLPDALRAAFPAISTRLIHNMKNTALASFVAVPELFQAVQTAVSRSFRAIEFLSMAAVLYLLLSLAFAALLRWTEMRLRRGRQFGETLATATAGTADE